MTNIWYTTLLFTVIYGTWSHVQKTPDIFHNVRLSSGVVRHILWQMTELRTSIITEYERSKNKCICFNWHVFFELPISQILSYYTTFKPILCKMIFFYYSLPPIWIWLLIIFILSLFSFILYFFNSLFLFLNYQNNFKFSSEFLYSHTWIVRYCS